MNFAEMNGEQLQARMDELIAETSEEKRDALGNDELEARITEMEALKAEIENRKAAAAEEARKAEEAAQMDGKPIIEEEKRMSFEVNTPEYRDAFLRNLQHKELTAEERTALVHGDYAIPQETANKIWGKLELYPILNAIDVMHIPGTVVLPVEGTVNPAAVVAMGTAANDSADELAKVNLGIYKIIKTIEITADVAAMAVPAFEEWLVDRLANKLFRKIADLVVVGTGTGTLTGLATISAMSTDYTSTGVTYGDLLNIVAELPSEYLPNASWLMSRTTFWGGVKALNSSSDVRVVNTDVGSPAAYNVLGFPVIIDDNASTDIYFGDLKEGYVLNFGKDVAVDRDESIGFRTGSTVFRGMALCDGKPTGVGIVRCEQDS
jgi:HK97 family phage major capsid protein